MAFDMDENGNITLVQGDDGEIVASGLLTDKNYTIYFAIQDKNRKFIGSEISVETNRQPSREIKIPASLTDLLKVPLGEETEEYYYSLKRCYLPDGIEDTLLLGTSEKDYFKKITVIPKKVEGD